MKITKITEKVVDYPITEEYDINVWCDTEWAENDRYVSLSFYPLWMTPDGYLTPDTSIDYTLRVSLNPRGPQQKKALAYITDLVNSDDVFSAEYTDWWSNECVLKDAPKLIEQFRNSLPRKGELNRFVKGE